MNYGRWNEWDCGLMKIKMKHYNEVSTEGNEMKHEQWNW